MGNCFKTPRGNNFLLLKSLKPIIQAYKSNKYLIIYNDNLNIKQKIDIKDKDKGRTLVII
jgi:hypothetical protein